MFQLDLGSGNDIRLDSVPPCDVTWYLNGKNHRENGPAWEYVDGDSGWCLNGKLHREDGPAIENFDGVNSWFLNGNNVTKEEVMQCSS